MPEGCSVALLSEDTAPEIERMQLEGLRRMPGWRKMELVGEMWHTVRTLALAGLRARHPNETPAQLRRPAPGRSDARAGVGRAGLRSAGGGGVMLEAELRDQVRVLLLQDEKMEAIKLVRDRMGWKLKQSKEYVDEIERWMQSLPTEKEPVSDPEIRAFVQRGALVQAVKRVRETTGWGLKEAKEYVDSVAEREGRQDGPPLEGSPPSESSSPRIPLLARLFQGRGRKGCE